MLRLVKLCLSEFCLVIISDNAVISAKPAILHFYYFIVLQFEIDVLRLSLIFFFTFLVSYTFTLVVYDCCK